MSTLILRTVLIVIGVNFLGCVSARTVVGPDGTENQLVSCYSVERCYENAREVCGGNYKIVHTSTDTSSTDGTPSTETKLLVKCDR